MSALPTTNLRVRVYIGRGFGTGRRRFEMWDAFGVGVGAVIWWRRETNLTGEGIASESRSGTAIAGSTKGHPAKDSALRTDAPSPVRKARWTVERVDPAPACEARVAELEDACMALLAAYEEEETEHGFPFDFELREAHRRLAEVVHIEEKTGGAPDE